MKSNVYVEYPSKSWDDMQRVHTQATKIGYEAAIENKEEFALAFAQYCLDIVHDVMGVPYKKLSKVNLIHFKLSLNK